MVSARDADQSELVKVVAQELKKHMEVPQWARFVKTGASKERPPEDKDWWYFRSASILRMVYNEGPIGVSRLQSFYGGLHRRGHKPAHFKKASGKIIRTILNDLERLKFVEKVNKPKKGRIITREGQSFLDKMTKQINN